MIIYDPFDKKLVTYNGSWKIADLNSRVEQLNIAQATIPGTTQMKPLTMVYFVDGYSPLRYFQIGGWEHPDWEVQSFPTTSGENISMEFNEITWMESDLGNKSGYYVFTYGKDYANNQMKWLYNGAEFDLEAHGIRLNGSGTPADGSTINVSYTVCLLYTSPSPRD